MRWRTVAVQWATVLVLLVAVLALNFYFPQFTSVDSGSAAGNRYHAIDGDSFSIGQTEIRLHGIDAPEFRQPCRDGGGNGLPCGKMAMETLSVLIRGHHISCKIIDKDRYGREVSVCHDGALNINREMVRLGWAVAYRKHSLNYVTAEQEARAAKRGIWQWDFEMPEDYRARSQAMEGSLTGDD